MSDAVDPAAPGPFHGPVSRTGIVERIRAIDLGDEPVTMRRRFAELVGEAEPPEMNEDAPGTIVYLHGGGYVFGSPRTHSRIAHGLAKRTGWTVKMPSYHLGPEARWPSQLDFVLSAVDAISGPMVLAGDSAGGHLALVTALKRVKRERPVDGLVLFSPNTDRSGLSRTRRRNDRIDPMVDDEGDTRMATLCFGAGFDPLDVQVSPVLDDLARLPPTYVEVGTEEVLLDDSRILLERARAVGAEMSLHVEEQGLHMGQIWTPWWDVANASLDRAAHFVSTLSV